MNTVDELLRNIIEEVNKFLSIKDSFREFMIKTSRDIIREAGYVIVEIHKGNLRSAKARLEGLRTLIRDFINKLSNHPELIYSGTAYNALAEYVEAELLYSIVTEFRVRGFDELGVHPIPYLQGLLDVVGELKRFIIDLTKSGDLEKAWRYFKVAEVIYEICRGLEYPDALVPGLRRKVDISRNIVESLRSFLVDVELRYKLINELKRAS